MSIDSVKRYPKPQNRTATFGLWFFMFIGLNLGTAQAEQSIKASSQPSLEVLGWVDPHFPNHRVNQALVDSFGLLWAATDEGLIRFDGLNTRWYRTTDEVGSLVSSTTHCLLEDKQRRFWVGTKSGLQLMDRKLGRFTTMLPKVIVWCLYEDSTGTLWVGCDKGIFRKPVGTSKFQPVDGPADLGVAAMVQHNGHMYAITSERHLVIVDDQKAEWSEITDSEHNDMTALTSNGTHLYASSIKYGLARLEDGDLNWFYSPQRINPSVGHVSDLAVAPDQSILIAGTEGLFRWLPDEKVMQPFGQTASNKEPILRLLFIDHNDLIWCAPEAGGLLYLDWHQAYQPWLNFSPGPDSMVRAILDEKDNGLWLATDHGLYPFTEGRWGKPLFKERPIMDVVRVDEKHLLVLTDSYLVTLDTHQPKNVYDQVLDRPWKALRRRDGLFWIGYNKGILLWHPTLGKKDDFPSGDGNHSNAENTVTSLLEDASGNLWFGTFGLGLHRLDPTTRKIDRFTKVSGDPTSLSGNDILDLIADPNGGIWVAILNGGLCLFDPNSLQAKRYDQANGLPNLSVTAMVRDQKGTIWLNTGEELVRFDPSAGSFDVFSKADGYRLDHSPAGSRFRVPNGGPIVFGGQAGIIYFDPDRQHRRPQSPVCFTDIYIDQQLTYHLLSPDDQVTLPRAGQSVSFQVQLLDLAAPKLARYRMIDKVDGPTKTDFTSTNQISFSDFLPLGGESTLSFQVRDRGFRLQEASLNIQAPRPVWLPLSIILAILVVILLAWSIHLLLAHRLRTRQRKLILEANLARSASALAEERAKHAETTFQMAQREQVLQKETTRVLQLHMEQISTEVSGEVHDGPLSHLQGLCLKLHGLRDKVPKGDVQNELGQLAERYLPDLCDHLRRVCGELLKPDFRCGLQAELLNYLSVIQAQAPHLETRLSYQLDEDSISITAKATLYRIFRTLLKNTVKHASADLVTIHFKHTGSEHQMSIRDNGCGFEVPEDFAILKERGHFGLYMAHYFAVSAGGRFEIRSDQGKGTEIQVWLPA